MASSRGRWASPERTVVWTEPPHRSTARRAPAQQEKTTAKVAVVYYLSRNGQLEHPHFMEVALSSPQDGLTLRDVLDRLVMLRGAGMADAYSWSSKRSYRNGYVWHDLTADDLVHPANGNEYVLKGSELLVLPQLSARPRDASASSSSSTSSCHAEIKNTPAASGRAARRKNWSSFDLGEYRVATVSRGFEADAATQTDERRGGRRGRNAAPESQARTELGSDEISPPPSSSSPDDTLETLIKNDVRVVADAVKTRCAAESEEVAAQGVIAGGRTRASAVLMQLISCGSIPAAPKQDKPRNTGERRFPRGRSDLSSGSTAADGFSGSMSGVGVGMEREYFSGSLVETNKTVSGDRAGELKRSSSFNADRARDMNMTNTTTTGCSKLELAAEEELVDGAPSSARCIPAAPRRPNNGSKKSPTNHDQVSRRRNQPEPAALTEEEN